MSRRDAPCDASYDVRVLLERAEACSRIDALLADARGGRSRAVLVRGDAGSGKSALLGYAGARADGFTHLRARGVESEAEIAFAGLYDLLRPILDRLDA